MSRHLGHRAPLLWLVLPLIAGLSLGKMFGGISPKWLLCGAVIAAVCTAIAAWRWPRAWAPGVCVAMILAGHAGYTLHRARLDVWDQLPPREARLSLRIDRVFGQADPKRASGFARVVRADEPLQELLGQHVYFSLTLKAGESPPVRSAVVSALGVLAPLPRHPPVETFDGYLAGAGMNFRLARGRLLATEKRASGYFRFCAAAAERFRKILGTGIALKRPALAGLLRAMMLGETRELTEEQHALFMQSGTMHLFAISGLNIAVIAGALQALLLPLRFSPWLRFIVGTVLLWLFVDITGAAPSAVRAFGMAVFLQAALLLRRPSNPLAAVTLSAFIVLLIAPLQIFSASFLMSYVIVVALLVLGLPLGETWTSFWTPWRDVPAVTLHRWQRIVAASWRATAATLAIGVATALAGMITSVEFFQLLTPGALAANLVLIPAAMLVTIGGFAALVCGLVGFSAGAVLCNHAAALVLFVIEHFVRISVRLPGAFLPAHFTAGWVGPTALAALTLALLLGYANGWQRKRGGFWPPFAIAALTLIFGVKFGS